MSNQQLTVLRDQFLEGWNSDTNTKRIQQFLPKDVPIDRFTAVVMRAVQEDSSLLAVDDKPSLYLACQRAAQDGLIPDKREGALVVYKTKDGDSYVSRVQWQPMIAGLRKILANHGFDLRAEVVYESDTFDYDLGDEPSITHKRPALGTPRGEVIGAYAIATEASTGRKWREVMDRTELDSVASTSRAKFGPWNGPFRSEMYRKTVAKRLFKQLPLIAEDLVDVVNRDNEQFDLDQAVPKSSDQAASVQEKVRQIAHAPQEKPQVKPAKQPEAEPYEMTGPEMEPDTSDVEFDGEEPGF